MIREQNTAVEVHDALLAAEAAFPALPAAAVPVRIGAVRGLDVQGRAPTAVFGRTRTEVGRLGDGDLVELTLHWDPPRPDRTAALTFTPSVVVSVGSEDVQTAHPRTDLHATARGWGRRLRVVLAAQTRDFAVTVKSDGDLRALQTTWRVPPAATHMWGTGTLVYASGHRVEAQGTTALLRPAFDGTLSRTTGSVYAHVEAEDVPLFRLGALWVRGEEVL